MNVRSVLRSLRRRCDWTGMSELAATRICEMLPAPLRLSALADDSGPNQREQRVHSHVSFGNFSNCLGRRHRTPMILTRTSADGFLTRKAEKEARGIIAGLHVLHSVGPSLYKERQRCWARACGALLQRIRVDINLWAK
mmetsp:Transcript_23839/g.52547  ORF Transcript_23839/g.52547 Transcript_23839/m.52547 type:complete len:139 (-) Transcript_23839:802-1218(-)